MNENGISQTFVSNKTNIPLPKLNLSLNGNRRMTFDEYELICGVLNVGIDKFLIARVPENNSSTKQREVGKMWFSRNFAELLLRRIDDLERRVKRLEQIEVKNILNTTEVNKEKLANLKDIEAGKENILTIEEIIKKGI